MSLVSVIPMKMGISVFTGAASEILAFVIASEKNIHCHSRPRFRGDKLQRESEIPVFTGMTIALSFSWG